MKGILADNNTQGQLEVLVRVWQTAYWAEIWADLRLTLHTLEELGLADDSTDDVVWRKCQADDIVLITANRNDDGPQSLQATIRQENRPSSLPVFTLADATRVMKDAAYAAKVAEKLLDYLFRIELLLGSGRIFVP